MNLCSGVVNSQRLLCSQNLVWNVCIKAFLYTKKTVVDESSKGSEKNEEESTKDDSEKDGDSQAEEVRYKHCLCI